LTNSKHVILACRYAAAMSKTIMLSAIALATSLTATSPALADEAPAPDAITPYADIRYRLELVDQSGLPEDATASTIRLRAGLKTAEWNGVSALVEGKSVVRLGPEHYNDTINGRTPYPVVADPADVLLNQAWIKYRLVEEIDATVGRQFINFDNQRWVWSPSWRQNDLTFDSIKISAKPAKNLALDYAYVWRVNRVFGPRSTQGTWRHNSIHLVRAGFESRPVGVVGVYGYFLDIPNAPSLSSKTLGIRLAGDQRKYITTGKPENPKSASSAIRASRRGSRRSVRKPALVASVIWG
jgi:hypothetical protein